MPNLKDLPGLENVLKNLRPSTSNPSMVTNMTPNEEFQYSQLLKIGFTEGEALLRAIHPEYFSDPRRVPKSITGGPQTMAASQTKSVTKSKNPPALLKVSSSNVTRKKKE